MATATSAWSVERVAVWGACARGGERGREYRVVCVGRGGGKSTRQGRKASTCGQLLDRKFYVSGD